MYDLENKHYIFKKTSGNSWHIFYSERYGLCYRIHEDKNRGWSTPEVLASDVFPDFDADMDRKNNIHIVYQDTKGNINYIHYDGNSQKSLCILKSKNPYTYRKFLSVIPRETGADILFVVRHNDKCILSHQFVTIDNPSNPKVIDYVMDNEVPYSFTRSNDGTITIFYQMSDGRYLQLGTKRLYPSTMQWGEFTPVTRFNGNCGYPKPITDIKDTMHLCYQRQQNGLFELIYQNKLTDKNIWSPETIIHSSVYPFKRSSLIYLNNRIIIFWIRNSTIFYSYSNVSENNWSKPQRYSLGAIRDIECAKYLSNTIYEQNNIIASEIPASFTRSYKLAFYEDVRTPNEYTPASQIKDLIVESLNTLKNNVDDLKKSITLLDEKLLSLESEKNHFSRELVKISLKLKDLDNVRTQSPVKMEQLEELYKKYSVLDKKIHEISKTIGQDITERDINNNDINDNNINDDDFNDINKETE